MYIHAANEREGPIASSLELRPISELLTENFVIPSYQRGYRWTKRQVTELLDDLHEFQRSRDQQKLREGAFYCLQPIVILPREDGAWELIDGQQRLTTLFLIMGHLDMIMKMLRKQRFGLSYETRPKSAAFLAAINEKEADSNIDFHHLFEAHQAIEDWFEQRDGSVMLNLLNCVLDPKDRNVQVIWYELAKTVDPIQVFVRLNVGKIPLTNAELIRALFLRDRNFGSESTVPSRIQVAQEWDALEKQLQDDRFWFFLHDGANDFAARIEYLFEIKVGQLGLERPAHEDYRTFVAYQNHFLEGASVDTCWREIRQLALRLEEWYRDRVLYHLVGFWIATSTDRSKDVIVDLLRQREQSTRDEFETYLKTRIFGTLLEGTLEKVDPQQISAVVGEQLRELRYDRTRHQPRIRAALLLFNIATLLRNTGSEMRFPFNLFKQDEWDIEHVRSVHSEMPGRVDDRKQWLDRVLEYWQQPHLGGTDDRVQDRNQLREDAEVLRDQKTLDSQAFELLYERILRHFGEREGSTVDHGIANLALLDQHTNRAYKNAVFPIKRRWILDLDKRGTFVPLCTTNVFLKYYSSDIEQMMFWRRDDATAYQEALIDHIAHFFGGEQGHGGAA